MQERLEKSRTYNTLRNIRFAVIGQIVGILLGFIVRRVFISTLNAEYLGLSGLFDNILKMLSLTELGVGISITFSLYEPLAKNDVSKVSALMALFKKAYTFIGVCVGVCGLAITPLLTLLIKEMPGIPEIYLIYMLYVLNSTLSYFYTYKRSLIIADQKKYIITIYHYCCFCLMTVLQAISLLLWHNYLLYLGIQIAFSLIENILVTGKARKLYPDIIENGKKYPLDAETKSTLKKNVFAVMLHKIGSFAVKGTDSILISRIVGLTAVGLYSNYLLITDALNKVYDLLFQSLTASVGNLGAIGDATAMERMFNNLNFAVGWLYGFSLTCLIVLLNPFIELWVGKEYLFPLSTVIIISISFYLTGMRKSVNVFRSAQGLFWLDRYRPPIEALVNLGVSICLGKKIGVDGIIIGTIISTLTTCFWTEPITLYAHSFKSSAQKYYLKYLYYALVTAACVVLTYYVCSLSLVKGFVGFVIRCAICLIVPNIVFAAIFCRTNEFQYYYTLLRKRLLFPRRL